MNEKTLRDKYFANAIFCIGDLVEDTSTGEQMKILDRGSNYVTVATSTGVIKKWLNEIQEQTLTEAVVISEKLTDPDFEILESGQIKLFGYETKNFNDELSTLVVEQFSEFSDLYSKHQIVKCLDIAIAEDNLDTAYELLQKVDKFYTNQNITTPFIVEALKTDIERRRLVEILATIAEIEPEKSNYATVVASINALKDKYKSRKQWEVLWPFFKMAQESGLSGILVNLPFNFNSGPMTEELSDDITIETLEENIDLFVEDLDLDDIYDTFLEEEFSDDLLSEVLSPESRIKMARKIKQHTATLSVKRERALNKSVSSNVLLDRARRLAETMLKRRMFHKSPSDMSRQEKERFESGAAKRKAVVSRLAQRLVNKVRGLQSARLHHNPSPVAPLRNIAGLNIAKSVSGAT
jgi:hypothetical protein